VKLPDKVCLITGAAGDLGQAVTTAFLAEGARLLLADLDLAPCAETVRSAGAGRAVAIQTDVAVAADVERMLQASLTHWGRVDVLVNCAGIVAHGRVEETSEADWDRVLAVNLKSAFLCSRAVIPVLRRQGSGCIINFASSAGKTGGGAVAASYAASKAGVISLTKSVAKELGEAGIRCNAVAPGTIDSRMMRRANPDDLERMRQQIPLRRFGLPVDVARAVLFLASDEAAYITGEILDVNGGLIMD